MTGETREKSSKGSPRGNVRRAPMEPLLYEVSRGPFDIQVRVSLRRRLSCLAIIFELYVRSNSSTFMAPRH